MTERLFERERESKRALLGLPKLTLALLFIRGVTKGYLLFQER